MTNLTSDSNGLTTANANPTTKVITGVVRLAYVNIREPRSFQGGPAKYGVCLIIPKTDTATLDAIQSAVRLAIHNSTWKFGGTVPDPSELKLPLRDGDSERGQDEAFRGAFFLNANSQFAPKVVDAERKPVQDLSAVYSGVYARVSIYFYGFKSSEGRGIACGLLIIQKISDGEPLGVRSSVEEDFAEGSGAGGASDSDLSGQVITVGSIPAAGVREDFLE